MVANVFNFLQSVKNTTNSCTLYEYVGLNCAQTLGVGFCCCGDFFFFFAFGKVSQSPLDT